MIDITTGWDRPYRPLQGDHSSAFMIELQPKSGAGTLPVHVHLLLDISGSMAGDKLNESKKFCINLMSALKSQDTLSITTFNDSVKEIVNNMEVSNVDQQQIQSQIDQIKAAGVTRLDLAIENVYQKKAQAGATFVILISDGRPTDKQGSRVSDSSHYYELAEKIGKKGIKIISVAFGDPKDYEPDFFNHLSIQAGGPFRFSPEADTLFDVLQQDIQMIQNTAVENTEVSFRFDIPGVQILWFGRAYPDKQFFEQTNKQTYLIGTLPQNEPQIFIVYLLTFSGLDISSGELQIGQVQIDCQGNFGDWQDVRKMTLIYTDNPEHLMFEDVNVRNWRLELQETAQTNKAVDAKKQGNQDAFERHLNAAKKTRDLLNKPIDDLENYRKTKKETDLESENLARLLAEARKSRR